MVFGYVVRFSAAFQAAFRSLSLGIAKKLLSGHFLLVLWHCATEHHDIAWKNIIWGEKPTYFLIGTLLHHSQLRTCPSSSCLFTANSSPALVSRIILIYTLRDKKHCVQVCCDFCYACFFCFLSLFFRRYLLNYLFENNKHVENHN